MTRLLLIEDAHDLARAIRRELEAAGYAVRWAPDGAEGLALFRREPPDLVILDWMLPGMDGLDVLRRIREAAPTPVLMLTARSEEADRVIGLELGADDYLPKPFGMRELLARVRALLRRVERSREIVAQDASGGSTPVHYGPLFIDPLARQAVLEGAALGLTRTEFDLLCLFAEHPGRAFSRPYLLDVVWGQTYIEGERSVDNAVARLRRKLGSLGEAIETVWGVGYRLRRRETRT